MSKKATKDSDLQGITRLVMDATIGITDIVEAMHEKVVHPPFLPSTPIQHLITNIAGFTYKNIRWSTKLIGGYIDKILGQLAPLIGEIKATDEREAIRSVLNGVIGDSLEEKENPLQITMQFRYQSKAIALDSKSLNATYSNINSKILVMVHGSCMNDIQWTRKEHNHGEALATALEKTPVYLHYNSGRHISSNGQIFNELMEELVQNWPVPVEELTIIAHSMGGLVTRSAHYYCEKQQNKWIKQLKKIVFLGTPHHGAPLEKIGNYVDVILKSTPYTKPFVRLGKIRSAGVTDLRYGNLVDKDWQDNDRFERKGDKRQLVPLPKYVACYSIAAVVAKKKASFSHQIVGDTMVTLKSALGQHKKPDKNLEFKDENIWVSYETSHVDLLSNSNVYTKIKEWLG